MSSLDNRVCEEIMTSVRKDEFWKDRTFVFSTNNLGMLKYADRVIFMSSGEIIHFCSPKEIKSTLEYSQISLKEEKEKIQVRNIF